MQFSRVEHVPEGSRLGVTTVPDGLNQPQQDENVPCRDAACVYPNGAMTA